MKHRGNLVKGVEQEHPDSLLFVLLPFFANVCGRISVTSTYVVEYKSLDAIDGKGFSAQVRQITKVYIERDEGSRVTGAAAFFRKLSADVAQGDALTATWFTDQQKASFRTPGDGA